ncbi:MAG: response regulator transcription factor, partial [Lachnospiraceae bacterium]|nr:response regulator transcription factor [Lachnospiraceae bacterium]
GLGADDYIKKPFSPEELRVRIGSHLRREQRGKKTFIAKGKFRFDMKGMKLYFESIPVSLTKGEYQICEYLARHSGQVFSKEQIFEEVFGFEKDSNEGTIATHIKNIRSKLSEFTSEPIKTVWGIGYKWEA